MKKVMGLTLVAALVAPVSLGWAEDQTVTEAVKNPETTYDKMKVKSNEKDIAQGEAKATMINQEQKEKKELRDEARKNYEKSLSENGAESDITKAAKSRYQDAEKDYLKLAQKQHKVQKAIRKDKQELNKAQEELKQDTQEQAK